MQKLYFICVVVSSLKKVVKKVIIFVYSSISDDRSHAVKDSSTTALNLCKLKDTALRLRLFFS